jgi:hypothetical protein
MGHNQRRQLGRELHRYPVFLGCTEQDLHALVEVAGEFRCRQRGALCAKGARQMRAMSPARASRASITGVPRWRSSAPETWWVRWRSCPAASAGPPCPPCAG